MIYYSFTKTTLSSTSFFNVLAKSLILLEIILILLEMILILLEMILILLEMILILLEIILILLEIILMLLEMILILLEIILILLPKSLTEADNLPQKWPRFSTAVQCVQLCILPRFPLLCNYAMWHAII